MYAAAESLAMQYDTDISLAFRRQLLSFRSCFHSQLSTNSTTFGSCPFDHALSSTFSDVWKATCSCDVASDRCNLWEFVLNPETGQKLPTKYYVSGASQWSGGSSDRKTTMLSSWIRPLLLTLLHKRRHENGSLTNDVDVGVLAYSL